MRIIQFPHPTLRRVSKPLRRVDDELRRIVRAMFVLMYQAKGIGLAANQVDLPYRLFVLNLNPDEAAAEDEQVFINPVLSQPKGSEEAEEGLPQPAWPCMPRCGDQKESRSTLTILLARKSKSRSRACSPGLCSTRPIISMVCCSSIG